MVDALTLTRVSTPAFNTVKNAPETERGALFQRLMLRNMALFYDVLRPHGNVLLSLYSFDTPYAMELLYLLLQMFNKLIIYDGVWVYCEDFFPRISQAEIVALCDDKPFVVEPKPRVDDVYAYLVGTLRTRCRRESLVLNERTHAQYIEELYDANIRRQLEMNVLTEEAKRAYNQYFIEHFRLIRDPSNRGKLQRIHSAIKKPEGMYLTDLIRRTHATKCLEVGMAFGISAFYMTKELVRTKGHLYSVDPFQSTQWNNNGVNLLRNNKLHVHHTLIEKKSLEALPALLGEHAGTFDLIFIDGWHTFDYTLVDFFYSNLLLKPGGYIVIDDALHKGVAKCVNYIQTNYKSFYRRMSSHKTIASFKKTREDTREWNFHSWF
jgi:predicted O-methyltransferase YrrM